MEYNNDPKLMDELLHVRAENSSLFREIHELKGMNDFLRKIIESLISSRNA